MEISKTNSNIINLKKNIYITTPKMRIPFKIENRYKNYYIKIEFSNLSKDSKMNEFYNNFSRLETSLVEQINKKFNFDLGLKSQIRRYKSYSPFLDVKIPILDIPIENAKGPMSILELNKNMFCNFTIYLDKL